MNDKLGDTTMKYMLFAGSTFYARGGMNDFYGLFDTVEAAENHLPSIKLDYHDTPDWYQVVNATSLEVVKWKGSAYNTLEPVYY